MLYSGYQSKAQCSCVVLFLFLSLNVLCERLYVWMRRRRDADAPIGWTKELLQFKEIIFSEIMFSNYAFLDLQCACQLEEKKAGIE